MDEQTVSYYRNNVETLIRRYESVTGGISHFFPWIFQKGEKVLDIGSGSGRDAAVLCSLGIDAYGIEPVDQFRKAAIAEHPELKEKLLPGSLPDDMSSVFANKYDGVLLSAVLMHIPDRQLFDSIFIIREIMKERGKLLISVPVERDDIIAGQDRDNNNRLMILRPEHQIRLLFERLGFKQESRWISRDALGREGITWLTIIFRLYGENGSKSADKIEEIINRDRKTASYKLALLRAICDVALTEFKSIHWLPGNKASIPIADIARKWIEYFWPIFENDIFIPQLRGEHPGSKNTVSFRQSLNTLIKYYAKAGGLDQFIYDRDYNNMPPDGEILLHIAEKEIKTAIQKGPVYYAGGGNSEDKPFFYNSQNRNIVMDADMVDEMVQIGYWIRDSILLRWAELTAVFSQKSPNKIKVSSGDVIPLLLIHPGFKRDVNIIKKVFKSRQVINCVWTGRDITKKFDIDHAIPFSLWRNNVLWNLFPANPRVNNQKNDSLPSKHLLMKRKEAIVDVWNEIYKFDPTQDRFLRDTSKLIGEDLTHNWETRLFSCFQEAIEVTAIRRNSERWEP